MKMRFWRYWGSTIGLKVIMAVSGVGLVGFVAFHLLGNLGVFLGRESYNDYAAFLQSLGGLLWIARFGLLAMFAAHITTGIVLSVRNRAARPDRYAGYSTQATTLSARLMLHTGLIVLLFVLYHLAHFTLGIVHPEYYHLLDPMGRPDVYNNFVLSFQSPLIAGLYIVANVALASHLWHATSSLFRTLGISAGRFRRPAALVGPAVGFVIGVGNISLPVACMLRFVQPEGVGVPF